MTTYNCPFQVPQIGDPARGVADELHMAAAVIADDLRRMHEPVDTERYADDDDKARMMIRHAALMLKNAEDVLRDTVAAARDAGLTWQSVGDVLEVSRQAAQERFSR